MKKPVSREKDPKELLREAEKIARSGGMKEGLELFEACIRGYLQKKMPLKALAAAKVAKTSLGGHPKVYALLIGLLKSLSLEGELKEEYAAISTALKKDAAAFRELTREEFTELLGIMQIISVKKGGYILRQQDAGEDMYLVIEGCVGVYRDNELVAVLLPGDVFGELGFFSQPNRSASVKALERCRLSRIPAPELRLLCGRLPGLRQALEGIYHERVLRKAGEELRHNPLADLKNDALTVVRFSRGQAITFDSPADVTIIKHGIVEVDMDEKGLRRKRFLRPGHVMERFEESARAGTDVEMIRARIDPLRKRHD
jgi:CRP-like cAMP-binding protein